MSTIGSATGEVPVMADARSHLERINDPHAIVPRHNRAPVVEPQETDMVEKSVAFRQGCLASAIQMQPGTASGRGGGVDEVLHTARKIEAYLCGEEDPDVTAAKETEARAAEEATAKATEAEAKKASKSKDG